MESTDISQAVSAQEFARSLASPVFAPYLSGKLAAAVSGGPDSMALASLLGQWAQERGKEPVHALVVDHGLRPESAREAGKTVEALVQIQGIEPFSLCWRGGAGTKSAVLEKAREARYALLEDHCRAHRIASLFLAHHRDDQAETFLIRLAKGSGLDGLSAMAPVRMEEGIALCRPLLDLPKARLIATCRARGIVFASDPSNANVAFLRPRLRAAREALEAEGLTSARLSVTAARLARAREALEFYACAVFAQALDSREENLILLNFKALSSLPEEIRLRVLYFAFAALRPDFSPQDVRMERFEALACDLFAPEPFRRRTLGGFAISRKDRTGKIVIEPEKNET